MQRLRVAPPPAQNAHGRFFDGGVNSIMGSVFSQPQMEPERRTWVPIAIGASVIVVALIAIFIFGRPSAPPPAPAVDPYAGFLQVGDLKMSVAENFVGGSVNYLEGKVANVGTKTVTGVTVEAIFRNSLGEVVQHESQPMMLINTGIQGFPDAAPLSAVPLTANTTREFRLTFEHISADWNRGYPELQFTKIKTK